MQLCSVSSWHWLASAGLLLLLHFAGTSSHAEEVAQNVAPAPSASSTSGVAVAPSVTIAPVVSAKPGDNPAPNAAVTARWPLEDTPQHTVGRPPTPESVVTEPEEPKTRGWSALLPKDPAPAGKAAVGTLAVSKHVGKSKSARATKVKSPRAGITQRSHRSAAVAAQPRTSGHAKSSRAAHNGVKARRPLALTPPVLRRTS